MQDDKEGNRRRRKILAKEDTLVITKLVTSECFNGVFLTDIPRKGEIDPQRFHLAIPFKISNHFELLVQARETAVFTMLYCSEAILIIKIAIELSFRQF